MVVYLARTNSIEITCAEEIIRIGIPQPVENILSGNFLM